MVDAKDAPMLTLEEMRARYDGEWVLIVDYEMDPETHDIARGRVVSHDVDRSVVDEAGDRLPAPIHVAYHCFREPGDGTVLIL